MSTHNLPSEAGSSQSGVGVLVRLGWMLGGFIAIVMTAMSIANHPTWSFGWRDVVFWSAVVASALFRSLDISRFEGQTVRGDPATDRDLRRYLLGLALCSGAVWTLVQSVHL